MVSLSRPRIARHIPTYNGYHDTPDTLEAAFVDVVESFENDTFEVAFVYYPRVDNMGHKFGPDAPETFDEVKTIDGVIKFFLDELDNHDLASSTNLVVVSDHGMSSNKDKV